METWNNSNTYQNIEDSNTHVKNIEDVKNVEDSNTYRVRKTNFGFEYRYIRLNKNIKDSITNVINIDDWNTFIRET